MKETKTRLADTGVEVLDVELFRVDSSLDAGSFIHVLEASAELGAENIIAQLPNPDRDCAIARFARLCDLAKPLGIFVNLEFLHWTETGNLEAVVKVVRAVKWRNACILVDTLHVGCSDSRLGVLDKLPRKWFRFAHVATRQRKCPRRRPASSRRRDERQFPGEGGIDVRHTLACLPPNIPYALEIPRVALTKAVGPEEVALLALRVARSHPDAATGERLPAAVDTPSVSRRRSAGAESRA